MKILLLLSLLFFFSSCSKDYSFKKNEKSISDELKKIVASDQAVRHNFTLLYGKFKIRDFYSVSDSLRNSPNKEAVIDYAKIPSQKKQIERLKKDMREDFDYYLKIFKKTNTYVDSINSLSLYKIINKYGYPSYYNRKWSDTINSRVGITFILTHIDSNSDFGKKMFKLMFKEYSKGRVSEGEMKHYLWDVDGRNGYPYEYVIEFDKWKKKANAK